MTPREDIASLIETWRNMRIALVDTVKSAYHRGGITEVEASEFLYDLKVHTDDIPRVLTSRRTVK